MYLHLKPEDVRQDLIGSGDISFNNLNSPYRYIDLYGKGSVEITSWTASYSVTGVLGEAAKATAEKGKAAYDEAVKHMCEFIDEWLDISDPVGVFIDENEWVWVISATLNRILKYSRDGELQYYWGAYGGTRGGFPGGLSRPHQLDVDQDGNVYVSSWDWPGHLSRFTPKPDADPAKLIAQSSG